MKQTDCNPFKEENYNNKTPDPCVVVIFGATGDLTARKLLPALFNLEQDNLLPSHFALVGFARRDKTDEIFRQEMKKGVEEHGRTALDPKKWELFQEHLFYHRSEFDNDEGYSRLKERLLEIDKKLGTRGNRVFYLSTPSKFFSGIVKKLKEHDLLADPEDPKRFTRVIIEKPFGVDLESARSLHEDLSCHLSEKQTYRIDHYLGKETVQNLLLLRFGNPFFEALWNSRHIDSVQITVSEEIGIGTRGNFFEGAGILRDIIQNHMMQLLSLVAMEPPYTLDAEAIRDEKVKVLHSLRKLPAKLASACARGQYGKGLIEGEEVLGYRQEENVSPSSNVETFAALKIYVDNFRWYGVPFYLRSGKRLPKRVSEIAIIFKDNPGFFPTKARGALSGNALSIRVQPNEGISLRMNCKVPGLYDMIQPVKMDFAYGTFFGLKPPDAYERLILDCMAGDSTLFARIDEVMASWTLLDPLVHYFLDHTAKDFPNYPSGTWGPHEADLLLERDQRRWRIL